MSSQLDETFNIRGEIVTVGLSQILGVSVIAGEEWAIFKYMSGGSLEIGGPSLTWGAGYMMGTSEALSFQMNSTFFLVAKGATSIGHLLRGVSSGNV